jgi:hypothetical protein
MSKKRKKKGKKKNKPLPKVEEPKVTVTTWWPGMYTVSRDSHDAPSSPNPILKSGVVRPDQVAEVPVTEAPRETRFTVWTYGAREVRDKFLESLAKSA